MQRVVLINDTSHTANPGCRGTVRCLKALLAGADLQVVSSLPVGYAHEQFLSCTTPARVRRLGRLLGRLRAKVDAPVWDWEAPRVDLTEYRRCAERLDSTLVQAGMWAECDLVVVNGEGSLHHNQPSALAIYALIQSALHAHRPVWLVNTSVQAMDSSLSTEVLSAVNHIAVREPYSHRWLREQGVSATLAADALFTARPPAASSRDSDANALRGVLYTPGVLAAAGQPGRLDEQSVVRVLRQLRDQGREPTYLAVEAEDDAFVECARRQGLAVERWTNWGSEQVLERIRRFGCLVSGRYHMLIYAALAGVPLTALSSNSWKVEGLLELLGLDQAHPCASPRHEHVTRAAELAALNVPIAARSVRDAVRPSSG